MKEMIFVSQDTYSEMQKKKLIWSNGITSVQRWPGRGNGEMFMFVNANENYNSSVVQILSTQISKWTNLSVFSHMLSSNVFLQLDTSKTPSFSDLSFILTFTFNLQYLSWLRICYLVPLQGLVAL